MTSELKSATARANGAKSRGPKSPETREKSSLNAITHGFTSRKTIVLESENNDQFHAMLADYVVAYQPGSPVEASLVDEMAGARWRTLRYRLIETALLDTEMNRPHPPTDPNPEPTDPGYQIAAAFRRLADNSRALPLLSRYESRLSRIHERAHRMLLELQQVRKKQTAESVPAPVPVQPTPPPPAIVEPGPALCPPRPDKKRRNEPTPARPAAARKHVQRRAIAGHRGIMSYLGTKSLRRLKPTRTAAPTTRLKMR